MPRRGGLGWTAAAAGVLVLGVGLRLMLGGAGVGDRSAVVMAALLGLCAWLAARLLGGARVAFVISLVAFGLFALAALPARDPPPYDDLQALYAPDQAIPVRLPAPTGSDVVLSVLVQPVFAGAQPTFGLAADVNGLRVGWRCAFSHTIQRLALPIPAGTLAQSESEVELRLTGTPSRDGDYLLVYSSAHSGGFLMSLVPASSVEPSATRCVLG